MEELEKFIASNPDARELKRALAVHMTLRGYIHEEICKILQVSSGFISKWKQVFLVEGVAGLKLAYRGSTGYLTPEEKEKVIKWLQSKSSWSLNELECYLIEEFDVIFAAKSSYYDLFHEAGIHWKKSQIINPRKDPEKVAQKKKEITEFLEKHRKEIESGELLVFFEDECHLLWGDICGYVWGKSGEKIEVPIGNQKERQTYYGALNYCSGRVSIKAYEAGNTSSTIDFISYLREQNPEKRIVIFWDGAKYHKSEEFRKYLEDINGEKPEEEWSVRCIILAPNAPEQNPIEDVWLQGKQLLRKLWHLCKSFKLVKWLFEWFIGQEEFQFSKLDMYGTFS